MIPFVAVVAWQNVKLYLFHFEILFPKRVLTYCILMLGDRLPFFLDVVTNIMF